MENNVKIEVQTKDDKAAEERLKEYSRKIGESIKKENDTEQ